MLGKGHGLTFSSSGGSWTRPLYSLSTIGVCVSSTLLPLQGGGWGIGAQCRMHTPSLPWPSPEGLEGEGAHNGQRVSRTLVKLNNRTRYLLAPADPRSSAKPYLS